MANSGKGGRSAALLGIFLLLLIGGAAVVWYLQGSAGGATGGLDRHVATAQNITLRVSSALAGDAEAFDELERRLGLLAEPGVVAAAAHGNDADAVRRGWGSFRQGLGQILGGRDAIMTGHDASASVRRRMPQMLTSMGDFFGGLDAAG